MELKVSSPDAEGLSPSDGLSDPEEKEISDDDDDDRNHKHRRRETQSLSLERHPPEQGLTMPYRKWNRPFENGHSYRENSSQPSETWKNFNSAPLEKDLSTKLEKRGPGFTTFPHMSIDLNHRIRGNQSLTGEPGNGRGRVRETGSWSQLDSRFNSADVAPQAVQQGAVPPSLFVGRGLPNVLNAQNASWNAFGLIPGMSNGGLDTLHSLGLQGTLRSSINPALNMGIPRQRCRDFEERGFCLRGDMCPMEHGVNRIVVEDVQSLSQFNLPVSLPSANLLGLTAGSGPLPSVNVPSSTLMNSTSLYNKSTKPGMADDGLGLNDAFTGSAGAGGADLYDPDQPLWTNDCPETSAKLLALNPRKVDEAESLLKSCHSDHHHARFCDGSDKEYPVKSSATATGSRSKNSSIWGRIDATKNRLEMKERIDPAMGSSNYIEKEAKEDQGPLTSLVSASHQGKQIIVEDIRPQSMDSSLKAPVDTRRNIRKPSQKALRTLFVNGIPQKSNKREALLSHFQKFGEVIDIYIPLNSERAFVQFSKREEAEAALMAPDAVMGNRFIKLWWANRDSIPDDGASGGNNASLTPYGVAVTSFPRHPSVTNKGKDNLQSAPPKVSSAHITIVSLPTDDSEHAVNDGFKVPPPLQKKLESLELLKEEIRKKQQMLDQKRNEFRQKLDKFERQASSIKGDVVVEQAAKKQRAGTVADVAKLTTPTSSGSGDAAAPLGAEVMGDKNKSVENLVRNSSKTGSIVALQQPSSLKPSVRTLAPEALPHVMNRFKLDNRPTAFKIIPPLPTDLTDVAVLKEHFSMYGDLSTVELEELESDASGQTKSKAALICFTTRRSAERAYVNGKCWQGHNLQFMWLTPSSFSIHGGGENPSSAFKGPSDANRQPAEDSSVYLRGAVLTGIGASENLTQKNGGLDSMGQDEELRLTSAAMSSERESPKSDAC